MGGLRDKVVREKENDINYYEESLLKIKENYAKIELMINELELINAPIPYTVGRSGIQFKYETEEEASELVSRLVIQFPAEKIGSFQKQFDSLDGKWYWEAPLYKDMHIRVHPAPVSEDCTPVQKECTYKSWVCEPKEGGER